MIPIPLEEPKSNCCNAKFIEETSKCSDCKENAVYIKSMHSINTFQAYRNEIYLVGLDEYGKDFQICFDSYNFLEWIDGGHLEYIKEELIKYIQEK
jgi:hypothetical protein